MDRMAQRVAARFVGAGMEDLVSDPKLKPKKLAERYIRELKKGVKGADVKLERANVTTPRGWDYGVLVELSVTLADGAATKAVFNLNVSDEESSGYVDLGYNFGGTIVTVRFDKPEKVVQRLIGDTVDHLK